MAPAKSVAGIVTVYRKWSHAEMILGKILDGFQHDGGPGPNLKLKSLYIDQFPEIDTGKATVARHGVHLAKTIDEAVTLGGNRVAVDGVLIIGEHGNYPDNEKGQRLYPRRRFFAETLKAFERCGSAVPVFNDKHLAATWEDAKWMVDAGRKQFVPMLAGSTVPLAWRRPELELPMNCDIRDAVQVGYGQLEAYGFHALEGLQCMVERRKGGETGVRSVQVLSGPAIWEAMDQGRFSKNLLETAFDRVPGKAKGDYRELTVRGNRKSSVMLIDYRDGLKAAVVITNGYLQDRDGGGFAFAGQLHGEQEPRTCQFYLQDADPFGHFIYLVKAIEAMVQTGHSPIPIERTLLTTGILDAAMTSHHEGGKRIDTPHLEIRYQPSRWAFARDPLPPTFRRPK